MAVEGAPQALAENISATLAGITATDLAGGHYRVRIRKMVEDAAQALGYYHSTHDLQVHEGTLRVVVQAGEPLYWAAPRLQLTGEGAEDPVILKLLTEHPFLDVTALNHGVYEAYKEQLVRTAQQQGYPLAELTRQVLLVDPNAGTAQVELSADTGDRFRLGGVEFVGTRIDHDVIYKLLNMEAGGWYQPNMLRDLQYQLLDTGYFVSADVRVASDIDSRTMLLRAYLQDEPKDRYTIGLGVATDTGTQVVFNWDKPIVNGRGHGLSLNSKLSKPVQNISTRYTIPWDHPREEYLEWVVAWQRKDNEDTLSSLTKTGVIWQHDLRTSKRSLGVNLEYEVYEQGSASEKSTTYILPLATWTRLVLPADEGNGYRYGINLLGSAEALGSDTDFLRGSVNGAYLYRLSKRHSLLGRAEVGKIFAAELSQVPASKRFFAGGQGSIRGFSFESISPRDPQGALTGADKLITSTLEYQYDFKPNWAIVGFVDSGKAFIYDDEPLRTGAGLGVRWKTPVGAVGIDIAVPVDDPEYDGFQLHFYLGPLI
ncbi:outer membrane protein assembly factor [Halieaceae bacterium IMCC14734]|uniref:Outer membrane protein assembly factor n=1 Tax=Candidatus Litorirhabdus singularis TaxID=2518993 RepID=A0ABT3TB90_9GAMM|nr:autotransporter assembly complex protein TamA [Candidatus Litorirhabdus singularis]MCX2979558.1 outer membrane protein assembly factor [Candidatus Litorirhabdus singularis]